MPFWDDNGMDHAISFSNTAREEQVIFNCSIRYTSRKTVTYFVLVSFRKYHDAAMQAYENRKLVRLSLTFCRYDPC
jgi:hypothetical protein